MLASRIFVPENGDLVTEIVDPEAAEASLIPKPYTRRRPLLLQPPLLLLCTTTTTTTTTTNTNPMKYNPTSRGLGLKTIQSCLKNIYLMYLIKMAH